MTDHEWDSNNIDALRNSQLPLNRAAFLFPFVGQTVFAIANDAMRGEGQIIKIHYNQKREMVLVVRFSDPFESWKNWPETDEAECVNTGFDVDFCGPDWTSVSGEFSIAIFESVYKFGACFLQKMTELEENHKRRVEQDLINQFVSLTAFRKEDAVIGNRLRVVFYGRRSSVGEIVVAVNDRGCLLRSIDDPVVFSFADGRGVYENKPFYVFADEKQANDFALRLLREKTREISESEITEAIRRREQERESMERSLMSNDCCNTGYRSTVNIPQMIRERQEERHAEEVYQDCVRRAGYGRFAR